MKTLLSNKWYRFEWDIRIGEKSMSSFYLQMSDKEKDLLIQAVKFKLQDLHASRQFVIRRDSDLKKIQNKNEHNNIVREIDLYESLLQQLKNE